MGGGGISLSEKKNRVILPKDEKLLRQTVAADNGGRRRLS
jgi:hypothetical protein